MTHQQKGQKSQDTKKAFHKIRSEYNKKNPQKRKNSPENRKGYIE